MIMLVVVGGGYSSPIIGKHIGNLLKGIFESKPTTVNTPRPTHPRGYRRIRPAFRPSPRIRPVQVQPVITHVNIPTTNLQRSSDCSEIDSLTISEFSSGNIVQQTRAQVDSAKKILRSLEGNEKAASSIEKAFESSDCLDNLEDALYEIEGAARLVEANAPEILYLVGTVERLKNEKNITKLMRYSAKNLRVMEDLIPNLALGPSTVCTTGPVESAVAFKDLANVLEEISNTLYNNNYLPCKTRQALQLSAKIMTETASFLESLNESVRSLKKLCSEEDKSAVYDTIGDILEDMAVLFETLGGADQATEIRKQGGFVKKIVVSFSDFLL